MMGLSPDGAKQSLDDHDSGKLLRKHGLWDRSKIRKMFRKGDLDASSEFPSTRHVRMGLPRPATFKRQNSEKRERLPPVDWKSPERRALSSSRNSAFASRRSSPPTPCHTMLQSVPCDDLTKEAQLESELESKWILNLSMHFRDRSDREKFFVTYADQPNRWRRVTVSCDYRDAEPGSLEMDLKELRCQRDKSLLIYESIRDSLPDIQFYDTVTNLKLQSSDGRLHVHVTEDVNEIIPYPQRRTVSHVLENSDSPIPPMEVRECDLEFDSHLSGFAYKVRYGGKDYIKKEIPGPDTVDEFLYEVNALHDLHDTESVIRLEAIVVDDSRQLVKGLLISYAERGALVDLPYDHKGQIAWEDRVRWASQAVRGMSQIHEGYVQGDFTLSNIVMDGENDAKIIDINRRGRPVGWEDLDDPDIAAWNPAGIVLKESSEYSPARGSARRGRGQRKNKAYWNAQQENVDFNPFQRDCLFGDADGGLNVPAVARMDSLSETPFRISMRYLRALGKVHEMSTNFEHPNGNDASIVGVVKNMPFRVKGTSVTLRQDFWVTLDDVADVLFGWRFMKSHFDLLFGKIRDAIVGTTSMIGNVVSALPGKFMDIATKAQSRVPDLMASPSVPPPPYSLFSVFAPDFL